MTTNNIYKEYEEAYGKLILKIKDKNILEAKEIQKLENYIKTDYKEDMEITELVELEEYEQKRTRIVEIISRVLSSINSKEEIRISQIVEEPREKDNKITARIIIDTTISEIQSSAKNILSRLPKKDDDLEQVEREFKEETKRIIQDAEQCVPEISDILHNHYHEVCEQLSGAIEKYNEKVETKKEETDMAHRREEFTKRISNYEQVKSVEISNIKQDEEVEELEH